LLCASSIRSGPSKDTVRYGSSDAEDVDSEYEATEESMPEFTQADRELFDQWTKPSTTQGLSLADLILSRLNETMMETDSKGPAQSNKIDEKPSLNPKIVEVYTKLGELLGRYRSGKLPKAFKVLPVLKNWKDILALTNPDAWTPHAVYQGTRLFSSTLNPVLTQRYYSAILLPHVQKDLLENKKLNYHLYLALKKAMYKPSAFFKGILIPICAEGEVTLKEASILASVLAKASIPVLHASACILKICELPYSGANSIFLRTFLDKKFTLPYRVVDSLVEHYCSFKDDPRPLFVLWHQSLLVFVERYKSELRREQKSQLSALVKIKRHPLISPEIHRELEQSLCREDLLTP
jgi:essential nuclear protein 1